MSASQQAVYSFLLRYVRSLNAEMLRRFLRFSTGSSVVTVDMMKVDFNVLTGLSRRITSHTCNPCLHLLTIYSSYTDFRAEFNGIPTGNQGTMDFVLRTFASNCLRCQILNVYYVCSVVGYLKRCCVDWHLIVFDDDLINE